MSPSAIDGASTIDVLAAIRAGCPALTCVFLPDDTWPDFKAWHVEPDAVAAHCSMLLLALQRGHLGRLTGPIHRYLIENGRLRSHVRSQYAKDLRERWMLYSDPLECHDKSRMFTGRLAELQCAEWLETRGWRIVGLEALRPGSDIETAAASGVIAAFEVKSIGSEDHDFAMICAAWHKDRLRAQFPLTSQSIICSFVFTRRQTVSSFQRAPDRGGSH